LLVLLAIAAVRLAGGEKPEFDVRCAGGIAMRETLSMSQV